MPPRAARRNRGAGWIWVPAAVARSLALAPARIEHLIEARRQARIEKDFAQADAIRQQLADAGVLLEDTPQGTTWRVKS